MAQHDILIINLVSLNIINLVSLNIRSNRIVIAEQQNLSVISEEAHFSFHLHRDWFRQLPSCARRLTRMTSQSRNSFLLGVVIASIIFFLAPLRPTVALATSKNGQTAQCINVSPLTLNTTQSAQQEVRQRRRIPILEYNNDWICVNKPPGLTVHRSKSTPKHERVLITSLKRQLGRKTFPVHRLDHRTSGAMLLAFDSETAGNLHDAAIRHGRKQYLALVRGEWTYPCGTRVVDKPLLVQSNVTKEARTKFTVLGTISLGSESSQHATPKYHGDKNEAQRAPTRSCSLLLCEPLTGRTHQIRRHAFSIGHPILGDSLHGDTLVNRWWRKERNLDRLALHCWTLEFTFDGRPQNCIAPLPTEFQHVLKSMPDLWESATALEPRLRMEPYDIEGGTFGRHYRRNKLTGAIPVVADADARIENQ